MENMPSRSRITFSITNHRLGFKIMEAGQLIS
uniref:Uncharacterized protein n=1 Tax=Anguilla anguilla TaxID=7936 RepID=A0A0E9PTE6_ANGAN